VSAGQLFDLRIPGATVTEAGVRLNVSVALQYLDAWLAGNGAAAINNLMEDAATAEISRSQLWQWRTARAMLADRSWFDADRYRSIREEELAALGGAGGGSGRLGAAAELLDRLVLDDEFAEFLTLGAYELLD
jgi:malate synthase